MVFGAVSPAATTSEHPRGPTPEVRRPAPVVPPPRPIVSVGPPPSAGPGGARNETVLFGAPGGRAATGDESWGSGAPSAPALVGAPSPAATDEATVAPPPEVKSQTMMFGRPSARPQPKVTSLESAGARGQTEGTVKVDLDSSLSAEVPRTRQDKTLLFAREEPPAPVPAHRPVPDPQARTVVFAVNPSVPAEPAPTRDGEALVTSAPAKNQTVMFGGGAAAESPEVATEAPRGAAAPASSDLEARFYGAAERETHPEGEHQQVELPPDSQLPYEGQGGHGDEGGGASEPDDAALASMRAAAQRRTTIAVVVFLLIALLMGLALAWYLFGRALVRGDAPRIEQDVLEAMATLRRDDDAAQEAAASQARALLVAHPESIIARSALVMALALAADDAAAEARRATQRASELERRAAARGGAPGARSAEAERAALATRELLARGRERQEALQRELVALNAALEAREVSSSDRLASLRARAVAAGVLGDVSALALAEEFRQQAQAPDSWADLALPEYVCNGGSSFSEALAQLEAVEARDDTFLRAYVLSARIHLLRRDTERAESQLARVLAFHPGHDSARRLQAWIVSQSQHD